MITFSNMIHEYTGDYLRVFEAFAGYGSQTIALSNLNINYELVGISEIDINAIIAYASIRGFNIEQTEKFEIMKSYLNSIGLCKDPKTNKSLKISKDKLIKLYNASKTYNNFGDIKLIDPYKIPDHDLFTYSFPCQDISVAGLKKGFSKNSNTRSSLLWCCANIISIKKPKYLLMENVKNLISKKMMPDFNKWLEFLSNEGYTNYYKILNAKDFNIPQNRERVFMISILGDSPYEFPTGIPSNLKLRDILEENVDESFYISKDKIKKLINNIDLTKIKNEKEYSNNSLSNNLNTANYKDSKHITTISQVISYKHKSLIMPFLTPNRIIKRQNGRRFKNNDDESFTLTSTDRHGIMMIGSIYPAGTKVQAGRIYDKNGLSPTLNSAEGGDRQPLIILENSDNESFFIDDNEIILDIKIRKLTPLEYFRLMGMKDEDYKKCVNAGLSKSALYKLAGNSIVINVLEEIFKKLFI